MSDYIVQSGFPSPMPFGVDFYTLSNEDCGFTADLVTGTNDNYVFYMPYPSSINLFEQTIIVWCIEFLYVSANSPNVGTTGVFQTLAIYMSMLNRDLTATFRGTLADAQDEWLKAQFAGPMHLGTCRANITAAASVEGTERHSPAFVANHQYTPPNPIDCLVPPVISLINGSTTHTLATNGIAAADFTTWERFAMRIWFTKRNLTRQEMDIRNSSVRWQRLDA